MNRRSKLILAMAVTLWFVIWIEMAAYAVHWLAFLLSTYLDR